MIGRQCTLLALAAVASVAMACSPEATTQDAASARADQIRTDGDRAATQVRRKADMERIGERARGAAAQDIAKSDAYQADRAASSAAGE